jgi:hypothetical protein
VILPCADTAEPITPVLIATRFGRAGTFQLRVGSVVVESKKIRQLLTQQATVDVCRFIQTV